MKKRVLIPTLIIGTLLTGSLAFGFGGNCGRSGDGCTGGGCNGKGKGAINYEQHEERMDRRLEMMTTVLELSEAQQGQIKSLFDQQWQDRQAQRGEMQAARDAMHEARIATPFDEADFRTKAAKQAEFRTEKMVARAKMQQQIKAVLTPEQQEKADKLGAMMGGRGEGRHGGKGCRS